MEVESCRVLLHSHSTEAWCEATLADLGMTQMAIMVGNSRCTLHFAARWTSCLPTVWVSPHTSGMSWLYHLLLQWCLLTDTGVLAPKVALCKGAWIVLASCTHSYAMFPGEQGHGDCSLNWFISSAGCDGKGYLTFPIYKGTNPADPSDIRHH